MQVQIRRILQMWIVGAVAVMSLICGASAANLDVTVPASLPITVSANGTITTATNAKIQNNSTSPIKISSIKVTAQNGWILASRSEASSGDRNEKKIAMSFNDSWMNSSGSVDVSNFESISPKGSGSLSYSAAIPMATTASSETAATSTIVVSLDYPTMLEDELWQETLQDQANLDHFWQSTITEIVFVDSYSATGQETAAASVDVDNAGCITAYIIGTKVIIAGNGTGKIMANRHSASMFRYGFDHLTSVDLTILDTRDAEDLSGLFYGASQLTELDLSNFDTRLVTETYNMFGDCSSLESIYVSDKWDLTNVTDSEEMFLNCTSLKGDIAFDSNYTDKTYAKTSGGYLTYRGATAKTLSLNINPDNGAVDSYSVFSAPTKKKGQE